MWRFFAFFICLTACTRFPALDDTVPPQAQDAAYPKLVPLNTILDPIEKEPDEIIDPEAIAESLIARGAALESRADTLRGDVIDPETKARLEGRTPES